MRMQDMDAYFESKGFKVERRYHSCDTDCNKGWYEFIITKNNNHQFGKYMWPDDQQTFMDRMIRDFERNFSDTERPRCKDFLVWSNDRPLTILDAVTRALMDREIVCIVNKRNWTIQTPHVLIKFTNDRRYVEQDGLHWDEIFVESTLYPDVLTNRCRDAIHINCYIPDEIIKAIDDTEEKFEVKKYICNDIRIAKEMWAMANRYLTPNYKIKNVIFNDPATIVFWSDGTKTVVKAQEGETFDPEKGLAMAISKKALGNKGNYCNELKKWLPKKYLCMYCGAETTNPDWGHMCDECKNEPLTPIPETLKKKICCDIKIPDLSGFKKAVTSLDALCKKIKDNQKEKAVKKAYDLAIEIRDEAEKDNKQLNYHDINAIICYLGEALAD